MTSRHSNGGPFGVTALSYERITRRVVLGRLGLFGLSLSATISGLTVACGSDRAVPTAERDCDAFIDFTTKSDGDPPSTLDTGQPVDFIQEAWVPPRKPRIADGQLVHGPAPASGSYANYYQARLENDCVVFGTSWTVDGADGSTVPGVMCLAAWSSIYESGTGKAVPKTPAHIVIDTITGVWQWWVSGGGGHAGDSLKVVKSGTFTPPESDGVAIWEVAVYLDIHRGVGHLSLPGDDAATGTRFTTLTDAEISTALAAVGLPATTIAAMQEGANVVMVEHFAVKSAEAARYPRFLTMWAKTRASSDNLVDVLSPGNCQAQASKPKEPPT